MQDHTNTALVLVLGISDWCKTYHHDNLEAHSCDKELKQELGNKVTKHYVVDTSWYYSGMSII